MLFGQVHHTGYLTDDIEKAVDFYVKQFGGECFARGENADGMKMAFVKFGEGEVELIEPADKSRLEGKTGLFIDHIGYVTDDLESGIAELGKKGITFQAPMVNKISGRRLAYMDAKHTLGTRIHLTQK